MSVRAPIHRDLAPALVVWEKAPPGIAARLASAAPALRIEITVGAGSLRHARAVDRATGRPVYFLLIVPEAEAARLREVVATSEHLAAAGVHTPRHVRTIAVEGGLVAVYEWCDGVFPLDHALDFSALGSAVRRLHAALKSLDSASIEARTCARLRRLEPKLSTLRANTVLRGHPRDGLILSYVERWAELTEGVRREATPTHGDLNPGNILLTAGPAFSFLDFEDAVHARLWAGCDLAKIIERLVLPRITALGTAWAAKASGGLLRSYDLGGSGIGVRLLDAMRWHIALSWLVIEAASASLSRAMATERDKMRQLALLVETTGHLPLAEFR